MKKALKLMLNSLFIIFFLVCSGCADPLYHEEASCNMLLDLKPEADFVACRLPGYLDSGFDWCQVPCPNGLVRLNMDGTSEPICDEQIRSSSVQYNKPPYDGVVLQEYPISYYWNSTQPWSYQPNGYYFMNSFPIEVTSTKNFVPEIAIYIHTAWGTRWEIGTTTVVETSGCSTKMRWEGSQSDANEAPLWISLHCKNCGELEEGDVLDIMVGEGTVTAAWAVYDNGWKEGEKFSLPSMGHVTRITFK